jgi:hypothetical protein
VWAGFGPWPHVTGLAQRPIPSQGASACKARSSRARVPGAACWRTHHRRNGGWLTVRPLPMARAGVGGGAGQGGGGWHSAK